MLCLQCLGIEFPEDSKAPVTYQLHENYDALHKCALAGCEGRHFFEYMLWRANRRNDNGGHFSPPSKTQAIFLMFARIFCCGPHQAN
jgi:hypothetical protein